MGVAGLLSYLRSAFPAAFVEVPHGCDHLYVDMNSLLHQVVRKSRTEAQALDALRVLLHELTWLEHRPRMTLTLSVDGPAPLAKLHEQQQRRLAKALQQKEPSKKRGFSSLSGLEVTVGTSFMRDVDAALRAWANERRDRFWSITVDPSSHAGEGEVKLFGHLARRCRSAEAEAEHALHLVLGGDADLVLLALASPARHVLVLDPSSRSGQSGRAPSAFSCHHFRQAALGREAPERPLVGSGG